MAGNYYLNAGTLKSNQSRKHLFANSTLRNKNSRLRLSYRHKHSWL